MQQFLATSLQFDEYENSLNDRYDHRMVHSRRVPGGRARIRPGDAVGECARQMRILKPAFSSPSDVALLDEAVRRLVGARECSGPDTRRRLDDGGNGSHRTSRSARESRSSIPSEASASMLDINGVLAGADLLVTAYGSRISDAVQLAEMPGMAVGDGNAQNASDKHAVGGSRSRSRSGDSPAESSSPTTATCAGSRPDAITGVREAIPLLPTASRRRRSHAGERPGDYRMGIEGTWYGEQALDDNPYRTTIEALRLRDGHCRAAVRSDSKSSRISRTCSTSGRRTTDPLVRRTPGMGGRWTTDVWAPLEGFMANAAVRYRW